MSFLKNKIARILLGILAVIILLISVATHGNNPVQRFAYTIMSPFFSAGEYVITPVRKFYNNVKNASSYEAEIEALKAQIGVLEARNKPREDYIRENERLKALLDLRDGAVKEYKTVTCRVVSYEPNSWYNTVMLSKGKSAGIEKGDVVITALGVVGKVTDVGPNWAQVSTILNISTSVGVKLARTGDVGVVSGDAALAEDKNLRLDYISNDKGIIIGDILVTSGLGGVYPEDLSLGKVTDIKTDGTGKLNYAVIAPSVDFSSLYEVLVVTDVEDVIIATPQPTEEPETTGEIPENSEAQAEDQEGNE